MEACLLDLGTSWRCGQIQAPATLPRGKIPRHPLDRRLIGPQIRSGQRVQEKILYPTGTRTSTHSIVQPISLNTDCAMVALLLMS
jgi:hypothetical protein